MQRSLILIIKTEKKESIRYCYKTQHLVRTYQGIDKCRKYKIISHLIADSGGLTHNNGLTESWGLLDSSELTYNCGLTA